MFKKRRVSLNLGGGAARGFAHVGVLRSFEEEKIPFDIIIGVSMGAFVGALYSLVPKHEYVKERLFQWLYSKAVQDSVVVTYNKSETETAKSIIKKINQLYTKTGVLGRVMLGTSMVHQKEIDEAFKCILPPIDLSRMRRPFVCSAVSLNSGKSKVFTNGSLRESVLASMALPMVFPPVEIAGELYVDGGVLDKVGIDAAKKLGYNKTIVVDVSNESLDEVKVRNGLDVMFRTEDIASLYRRKRQLRKATVLIRPIKGNIHWADYSSVNEIIDMGYESARDKIREIRYKLKLLTSYRKFFLMFHRNNEIKATKKS